MSGTATKAICEAIDKRMSGRSYIGLHRKDAKMAEPTEKQLALVIGFDSDDVRAATESLNELAAAAVRAKEALDELFGSPGGIVNNVVVQSPISEAAEQIANEVDEAMASMKIRQPHRRFKL